MSRLVSLSIGYEFQWAQDVALDPEHYLATSTDVLDYVREHVSDFENDGRFCTNNPTIARAFFALHKLREITIFNVRHVPTNRAYHVDVRGELIQPWPDEFFERDFYLIFPNAKD